MKDRVHISIHSPLAGRDALDGPALRLQRDFNPLAPRGARRRCGRGRRRYGHFNPLAPRGARHNRCLTGDEVLIFQSTRPSRGETKLLEGLVDGIIISIHSPLAGRDPERSRVRRATRLFQSTRPSRGETQPSTSEACSGVNFNPLAPRGARRGRHSRPFRRSVYFNPLAPRGARLRAHDREHKYQHFNPLAPRGARRISFRWDGGD